MSLDFRRSSPVKHVIDIQNTISAILVPSVWTKGCGCRGLSLPTGVTQITPAVGKCTSEVETTKHSFSRPKESIGEPPYWAAMTASLLKSLYNRAHKAIFWATLVWWFLFETCVRRRGYFWRGDHCMKVVLVASAGAAGIGIRRLTPLLSSSVSNYTMSEIQKRLTG